MRDDKMLDIWRLAPAFSTGADADGANAIEAMDSVFSGGGAK